ncbi:ribonuclease P protein component [Ramlibacter sp. AW1]|uniref:Ribonuclease P protein component n=1 Tax=Ramlibacter aurantiacus TaxID=2801330 RepID=A0A936ZPQ7_9BURK|nr:ribonuclease P protein component [Ramlibacter aurantiacus]MBL0421270.1 ribonuclease P protein component [Ramlibacter aurantiacus]
MLRLKTRSQFQAVMAGQTVSRTAHFALHRVPSNPAMPSQASTADTQVSTADAGLLLGVVIPKRWARRAVTRNTIRRQIFAVADEVASALPPVAHVVRLRAGFDREQFVSATSERLRSVVRAELRQLFSRALRC